MLWALLSVLSGLGDAVMFALMKKLKQVNSSIVVWVHYAFALPFLLILLYFNYPRKINADVYWNAALNAALLLFSTYLLIKAIQTSKLSITMPMLSFTPLFLLFTSYLMLNEIPTQLGFIGVFLIVLGAYIIHIEDYKKGFFSPFKALVKDKGSFYVLIVAFIWSITANLFKLGMLGSNPIFFSVAVYLAISIIMLPVVFTRQNIDSIKSHFNMLFFLGLASAFMIVTASYAIISAIVPYVISLKRSSILFAIFLGYFFFNEKSIRNALIGTIVMLVGGILITLF